MTRHLSKSGLKDGITLNPEPARREFVPLDVPDEIRPSVGEAYRAYRVNAPSESDVFWRLASVVSIALLLIAGLASWAFL